MKDTVLGGWRKSSRSNNDNCVEVGVAAGVAGIRDTKNREGGTLVVDRDTFTAFITAVKASRI